MTNRNKIILFFVTACLGVGLDQFTKQLAKKYLMNHEPITYLWDTIRLEYVENTGAFLSLGADLPQSVSFWVFSVIPIIFLVILVYGAMKQINELPLWGFLAFSLIFAGGFGNIIDRIVYDRHVTDFLNFGIGSLRTGILNVADMYVTFGVFAIFFLYWKQRKENDGKTFLDTPAPKDE